MGNKKKKPINYKVANGEQDTVQEQKAPRYVLYNGVLCNFNDLQNENS